MKEFTRNNKTGGQTKYRITEKRNGRQTMEITYPGGYRTKFNEADGYYIMPWGFVTDYGTHVCIQDEDDERVFDWIKDADLYEKEGLKGFIRNGEVVFPPVLEQAEWVGEALFLKKGDSYALLRGCGTSVYSAGYDANDGFFVEGGRMGWHTDGKTVVPALYESISRWCGMDVFVAVRDGRTYYFDSQGNEKFTGDEMEYNQRTNDGDSLSVISVSQGTMQTGVNTIKSDDGGICFEVKGLGRNGIISQLAEEGDSLKISEDALKLLTDDCSYEFSAYRAFSDRPGPVKDCIHQFFNILKVDDNTWHYHLKIWTAPGCRPDAEEIQSLRHHFLSMKRCPPITFNVGIGEDRMLKEGEVSMLLVTHFHDSGPCWGRKKSLLDHWKEDSPEEFCSLIESLGEKARTQAGRKALQNKIRPIFWNLHLRKKWKEAGRMLDTVAEYADIRDCSVSLCQSPFSSSFGLYLNSIRDLKYYESLTEWALTKGADPNGICDGRTPLDELERCLAECEDLDDDERKHITPGKIAMVRSLREVLLRNGARHLSDILSDEMAESTDYDREICRLKEYIASFR